MGTKTHHHHPGSDSDEEGSVVILNRQRFRRVDRTALAQVAQQVLAEIGHGDVRATITLVSDQRIQSLNRTHRTLNQPTDVLAFPNEPDFPHEASGRQDLGDVIISTETAARDAARFGISFDRELKNLIIHGLLHLCGYDHETDQGEMKQLERRLRRRLSAISLQPSASGKPTAVIQPDASHRKKVRTPLSRRAVKTARKRMAER